MPVTRADELDARPADNAKELLALDVDALAQEIRRVDGSNSFGAGALAEALMPFIGSRLAARQQASVESSAGVKAQYPWIGENDPAIYRRAWDAFVESSCDSDKTTIECIKSVVDTALAARPDTAEARLGEALKRSQQERDHFRLLYRRTDTECANVEARCAQLLIALKRAREAVNAIVLSTHSVSFKADLDAIDEALSPPSGGDVAKESEGVNQ
jgi:hypothetical protein